MTGDVTRLLQQVSAGDEGAISRLFEVVYEELRARARAQLAGSAPQTIGATALVHEAYLKLTAGDKLDWNDRTHFYRVAARAMRQIAIDRARARKAIRRGGDAVRVDLDAARIPFDDTAQTLLELDAALDALEKRNDRLARLVELRFFAGLNYVEIAETLDISRATAVRDWEAAKAWLNRALDDTGADAG